MDKIPGLADKSSDFATFLTVSQKFKYSCVYIFHINNPMETMWKLILLQTKILNIFFGSVEHSSIFKILLTNYIWGTVSYLLQNPLWINKFFANLANKSEKN